MASQQSIDALAAFEAVPASEKVATAAAAGFVPATSAERRSVWRGLYVVLTILSVASLAAGVGLSLIPNATDPSILFGVPAAAIAGVFGLFAKGPNN
jgi:hypothetical protein